MRQSPSAWILRRKTAGLIELPNPRQGWFKALSALLAITFTLIHIPVAGASPPELPGWLKEEEGGWVSAEQARKLQRADQSLLTYLAALEQAQQRFITTHPSGLQTRFVGQEAVVARDSAGNLLWSPTLDDYRKIRNGTLLLADGTLQVVRNGQLARQVAVDGNEAVYRPDGRLDYEVAPDGIRTDYSYSATGFTRTTRLPNGNLVQEYNAQGRLARETTPEGKIFTYSNGILSSVSAGGVTYTYTAQTAADGTIIVTFSEAQDSAGNKATFAEGRIATLRLANGTLLTNLQMDAAGDVLAANVILPDGTRQTIAGGRVTSVLQTDGRTFNYDAGWLRTLAQNGQTTSFTYTPNASGGFATVTAQTPGGVARTYNAGGQLVETRRPDGTVETFLDGTSPRWRYFEPFDAAAARDFTLSSGVSITRGSLRLAGNGSNLAVNALFNRTWNRAGGETTITLPFMVSANDSRALLALEGTTASGAYRRIELYHEGSRLRVRTRAGSSTTLRATPVSKVSLNALYWVKFRATPTGTAVTVWRDGQTPPSTPAYTWTTADWQPRLHVWVQRGTLQINQVTVETPAPAGRETLAVLNQLAQPANPYRTDLAARAARDLPAVTLTYPGPPASVNVNSPGGLWETGSWPVTPDTLPPTGSAAGPAITNQRQITLNLTALDPAAADGTTGSGLSAMRFSLNGGQTWTESEAVSGTKTVTLPNQDAIHSILVQFQDLAGNWSAPLSHTVTLDTVPPALLLQSPALTNQPAYTLAYSVDGANRSEELTLAEGANTITRSATDPAGNTSDATWTITLDTVPPALLLQSPALTNRPAYTLAYSVDGVAKSEPVTLQEGENTLTRSASDLAGNTTSATWTITLDTVPPALLLQSPALTNRPAYTLAYSVDGANRSEELTLAEGANTITRSATDPAGNTSDATWTITLDTVAPAAVLTSPALTNQPEYTLAYTLDGVARQEQLRLSEGENAFTRSFSDPAGNVTDALWTVTLDTTPPALSLDSSPSTHAELYTATILADGQPISTESWRLGRGTHHLIAQAEDAVGNTSRARLQAVRTGTLPEPADPPPLPAGQRLTQTLADGSIATYVDGRLVLVTTADGTRLIAPVLNAESRIAGGWLAAPDGTTTYLENGAAVWSKTPLGAVYWYSPNGWIEAVRAADGTLTAYAYRLNDSGEVTAILASTSQQSTLFDADGNVTRRVGADGQPIPNDSADLPAAFHLEEIAGRITGLSVARDETVRTYDAAGNLIRLTFADQTVLHFSEGALKSVELPDGTRITGGVYDSENRLVSGVVTLPDGRQVTYADGKPTRANLPDGTRILYTDGQPSQLILAGGLIYTLRLGSHREGDAAPHWIATLDPSVRPDPTGSDPAGSDPNGSFTRLTYSSDWILQQATRADGAQLAYANGRLSTLTQPDGTVISYAYDPQGRLASTVAASPDPAEAPIRSEYAYDKIRRVFKGSDPAGSDPSWALLYDYSYEFEPDGAEVTVVREIQSGLIKRYRAGLLLSQTDPDGAITTYEYTQDPAGYREPAVHAAGASRTLADGTQLRFQRTGPRPYDFALAQLRLPDGRTLSGVGQNPDPLANVNGVAAAQGKLGQAARFSAAERQRLVAADSADLSMGEMGFTFSAWVYLESKPAEGVIFHKGDPSGTEYLLRYDGGGTDRFAFVIRDSQGRWARAHAHDSLGSPALNTWYHILAWFDPVEQWIQLQISNSARLDGAPMPTGSFDSAGELIFGDYLSSGAGSPFDGRVDEFAVWRRVLSEQERLDLYRDGAGNRFDPATHRFEQDSAGTLADGLVTYYDFEQGPAAWKDATDVSHLLDAPFLPADPQALRRLEQQNGLAWTPADALDQRIHSAVAATRKPLDHNSLITYEKREPGVWRVSGVTLADGTDAADAIPNRSALTNIDGVGAVAGMRGQAADFDPNKSHPHLRRPDSPALSMGDAPSFTLSAWVRLADKQAERVILSKWDSAANDREYELLYSSNSDRFEFRLSPDGSEVVTARAEGLGSPQTGTWYFLTAWYDGRGRIGIQVNELPPDLVPFTHRPRDGNSPFGLGAREAGRTEIPWFGQIDEVGIWRRLLTAQERAALYNSGQGNVYRRRNFSFEQDDRYNTLLQDLAAYYSMDEPEGLGTDSAPSARILHELERAGIPDSWAALRRMVQEGRLTLHQPEPVGSDPNGVGVRPLQGFGTQSPILSRATVTYQGKPRDVFTYRYGSSDGSGSRGLTYVTDSAGMIRSYDSTGRLAALQQPNGTRYEISYDRDLSESQILRLASLHSNDPELLSILKNPEGNQIVTHRLTRLALPDGSVIASNFSAETVVEQEFDAAGQLLSRTQANGLVTLYENNRPVRTYDPQGNLTTTFDYDAAGRLTKIALLAARRELTNQIAQLKADIPARRSRALEELARQRGAVIDQVQAQFSSGRSQLNSQLSTLQSQLNDLENTRARGRRGRREKNEAMDQIRGAMNQVRDAQNSLEAQYAQALGNLESQVESVRQQIETESAKAVSEIETRSAEFYQQILRQEISSIVISAYRYTIGRDPSDQEFQEEIQRLYDRYGSDPTAAVDLTDLTQRIRTLPDYSARATQVAAIKQQVTAWLTNYAQGLSPQGIVPEMISSLGLSPAEVVSLSSSDVQRILAWLNSRSLHFGHSAFLALQEYLQGLSPQGTVPDFITLAVEATLTDILTGVLNPKVQSNADLEISLFALGHLARLHGASATAAQVAFSDLPTLLSAGPAIAHVNGNHYILVTSIAADGTVTYREPNQGPTGQTLTMSSQQFQRVWKGVVLTPRAPPRPWQVLTDAESQRITGSFFPLIFAALAWIASGITVAIGAVVGAISTLLVGLGSLLSAIFSAIGTAFSSIGSFFGGFGSLFSGFGTIGQGFGAIFAGNILGGLGLIGQGIATAIGLSSLTQFALTTALNIGVSKGLEALGVNSTIASLAGAFAGGFIAGIPAAGAGASASTTAAAGSTGFLKSAIAGGLTSTAIAGTQLGLAKASLDPQLASLAGIGVGAITNSLTVGVQKIDPLTGKGMVDKLGKPVMARGLEGLGQTFRTSLAPTLAGELAFYGVQKLGETIGLDPRISQLASMPIKAGIGNITRLGNSAKSTLDAMWQGLKQGAAQVGLQFATQGLDPTLGGLASSAIAGAIDGLVTAQNPLDPASKRKGIFAGIADTLTHAIGGFTEIGLIKPGDPVATAQGLAKLNDFSTIIREQGLGAAVETYATSLLYRSSVESLLSASNNFSIQRAINAQLQDPNNRVELDGQSTIQISLGAGPNGQRQYLWVDPTTNALVASLQGQDYIKYGTILVDPTTRTLGAPNAEVTRTIVNPLTAEQVTSKIHLETAGADWIEIQDPSGISYRITPNSFQHVRLNADGTIKDGILTDQQAGTKIYFRDGVLVNTRRIGRAVITIGNDGKITVDGSTLEPKDANQMAVEFSIDEQIHNGEVTSDIQLDLDDAQKGILNNLNIDYPFMAQAFAEEVSKTENKTESSNYLKHRYEAYNRLNDAEKTFVRNPLNWGLTQKFEEAAIVATNLAVQKAIASGPSQARASIHNGKADAFRHALWAALLVQAGGTDKAKQFLDAHEQDPEQSLFEKEMDSHNNTAGIEIGKSNPNSSIDQLVSLIDQAMKDNKLTWLNDD